MLEANSDKHNSNDGPCSGCDMVDTTDSSCDNDEGLQRSGGHDWEEMHSSQDLSKPDSLTLPTNGTNSESGADTATLPLSFLPEDLKIRLAVATSLASVADASRALPYDESSTVRNENRQHDSTSSHTPSIHHPPKVLSQQELAREFARAYELRQQAARNAMDSRPTPPPDEMTAFPAQVVVVAAVCEQESMLCLQDCVVIAEVEDERRRK